MHTRVHYTSMYLYNLCNLMHVCALVHVCRILLYAWYICMHVSFTYGIYLGELMHKHELTGLGQSGPQTGSKIPSLGLVKSSGDLARKHTSLCWMFANQPPLDLHIAWMKNRCLQQFCTMISAGGKALVLVCQGLEPDNTPQQIPFPVEASNSGG